MSAFGPHDNSTALHGALSLWAAACLNAVVAIAVCVVVAAAVHSVYARRQQAADPLHVQLVPMLDTREGVPGGAGGDSLISP